MIPVNEMNSAKSRTAEKPPIKKFQEHASTEQIFDQKKRHSVSLLANHVLYFPHKLLGGKDNELSNENYRAGVSGV